MGKGIQAIQDGAFQNTSISTVYWYAGQSSAVTASAFTGTNVVDVWVEDAASANEPYFEALFGPAVNVRVPEGSTDDDAETYDTSRVNHPHAGAWRQRRGPAGRP